MQVPRSILLELRHVRQNLFASLHVFLGLLFHSRSAAEVVAAKLCAVSTFHWLLGVQVPGSQLLQSCRLLHDLLALQHIVEVVILLCRSTREVVAGAGGCRWFHRAFRVQVVRGKLLEFGSLFQNADTFVHLLLGLRILS